MTGMRAEGEMMLETIFYLVMFPVILIVCILVFGPIRFSAIKERWGYRGVWWYALIVVTAIVIWVFVFERM